MINILCALRCEARPLIEEFGLKRNLAVRQFEIFESNELRLIISGIGKIRAAAATAYLLARSEDLSSELFFNIGICGGKLEFAIGDLFLINKIVDDTLGKQFYSDLLVRHGLHEAALQSFDSPMVASNMEDPDFDLADMEGSAFFEVASIFLGPHQIFCLKIVSDHLDAEPISEDLVQSLISKNLESLCSFIFAQCSTLQSKAGAGEPNQHLIEVCEALSLSFCERIELSKLYGIFSRKRGDFAKVAGSVTGELNTSEQRKRAFALLKKALAEV